LFTQAIEIATRFTNPFVGLRRRENGEVFTTMGAFVVINADGWVVTSGHIAEEVVGHGKAADPADAAGQRVVAHSELWAIPGFMTSQPRLAEVHINHVADLALCRLEPFDAEAVSAFPVFRDVAASPIEQGMSICRLGFPFCDVPASYHEDRDEFVLDDKAFPIPRFALDGIVARFNRRVTEDGSSSALFIETSTPGLRGQSGGPLLDRAGRLCGLQSHTSHVDLGFDAQYATDDGVVTERQFLNVGAATHVDEIRALCDSVDATYRLG
jgi:hypothetical protein